MARPKYKELFLKESNKRCKAERQLNALRNKVNKYEKALAIYGENVKLTILDRFENAESYDLNYEDYMAVKCYFDKHARINDMIADEDQGFSQLYYNYKYIRCVNEQKQ